MSGTLVLRDIGKLLVPEIFLVAAELIYRELGAVAFDVAGRTMIRVRRPPNGVNASMENAAVVPSSNTISLTK